MKVYQAKTIHLAPLKGKKIAILGYGSQGRAQALNLRDSGCDVVIGLRKNSSSFRKAKKDGWMALPFDKALMKADVICFLLPDEFHQQIYEKHVFPILKKGMTLVFAHGFNITYQKIIPPSFIHVCLASPKGPGPKLREVYLAKKGLPFLISVHQDPSGVTKNFVLAFMKAAGGSMAFETTFREETITDLFGEQTVLCGGIIELMKTAFHVLVKKGLSAEAAYFECFHELKFIVDILHKMGISGMGKVISSTAHYGGLTRGKRLINKSVQEELEAILEEIISGEFAEEWLGENKKGLLNYQRWVQEVKNHPIEKIGKRIRNMVYSESSS